MGAEPLAPLGQRSHSHSRRHSRRRVAVVGGGWAGLAAAVRASEAGHRVTLIEMAAQLGGRARRVDVQGLALDNGQHILIGAYSRTLALMATVGADSHALLHRQPLELRYPDGRGLRMPAGPPWLGFGAAVAGCVGWTWRDRLALLRAAVGWAAAGFRCDAALSVDALCSGLPSAVRELLIDPLCVAALNTAADQASGQVFLRVLQDALFSGRGSADLMLPRADLSALLPTPAGRWLQAQGADVRTFQRIGSIARVGNRYSNSNSGGSSGGSSGGGSGSGWQLDGEDFDTVVLACTAAEAARLVQPVAPSWAANAAAITYEPIVTVYLRCAGARLLCPMTALVAGPEAPAQYAFDHGALGATPGLFAFVVSGARAWVDRGLQATGEAVLRQAQHAFVGGSRSVPSVLRVMAEKRATFCCTPALQRPPMEIAPGLLAAGDYVAGPYPATLEGAVRSGEAAVRGLERWS